jgi:hypothetical protein
MPQTGAMSRHNFAVRRREVKIALTTYDGATFGDCKTHTYLNPGFYTLAGQADSYATDTSSVPPVMALTPRISREIQLRLIRLRG